MPNSYFDSSKSIDAERWAVTLARSSFGEHAQLIVEGITNDGIYICQYAHFVGPNTSRAGLRNGSYLFWSKAGQVKAFRNIAPDKLSLGDSRTWIVNKNRANRLIDHVNSQPSSRPFHIVGDLEYGSFGELLFIGKEYLKASPDIALDIFIELLQLYLAYSLFRLIGFASNFSLFTSVVALLLKDVFYKTALEGLWPIYKILFATSQHPTPFVRTLQAVNFDELENIVANISDLEMPNNCFTWAEKELQVAGIHVYRGFYPRTSNALSKP